MRPMAGGAGVDVRQEESPITTTGPPEGHNRYRHHIYQYHRNLICRYYLYLLSPHHLFLSKNQFGESVEIKDLSAHGGEWVG